MVGPECRPPSALKKAAMAGHDSYYEMGKYSRITTWIVLAIIGMAILRRLIARLRKSPRKSVALSVLKFPGYSPASAVCRGIGYYRPKKLVSRSSILNEIVSADRIPALGTILSIGIPSIGLICWCFAVKPYYRPTVVWGSTPLGVRSGMIANALVPFLFCFGLKFNPITMLAGISHEKLQVFHQWTARVILFFSIVHTVAFLWQPVHDGGFSNLKAWYYYDKVWWTGTVALAFFVWLVLSSFGCFRRRSYRFFVLQHIVSIIFFLVFYFMHTRDLLSSWAWLWPSIGLWGFHILLKFANSLRISSFVGIKATLTMLEDDQSLMELVTVAPATWRPGQHFFVRFPTLGGTAPYQSHPFTVTNLPSVYSSQDSQLVFYFKARRGLTRQLWDRAATKGSVSTIRIALDGPYGCPFNAKPYHSVLLVAAGIGVTAVLPTLMHLCTTVGTVRAPLTKKLAVVWCIPSIELYSTFSPKLRPILEHLQILGVDVNMDVFCSPHLSSCADEKEVADEEKIVTVHAERASIPTVIERFTDAASSDPSAAVSICGPASMLNETANTVARLQWTHVLSSSTVLKELYLHTEAFDW